MLPKKIPFDSLCLAAIACELQPLVGGRLQKVLQPRERTLVLGIYAGGKERHVLLSCSIEFARVHFTSVIPSVPGAQPPLGAALRHHADGARIAAIRQIGFDRQLEILLHKPEGEFRLIAELTGRHANLILVGPEGKVVAAAHHVSRQKSIRPILPGILYEPPPFPPRPPVYEAKTEEEMKDSEGASPFLLKLIQSNKSHTPFLQALRQAVQTCTFSPVSIEGLGAYPISVQALGFEEKPVDSLSQALDSHFRTAEEHSEREQARTRLLTPLKRVLLAREVALQDLAQAEDAARRAGDLQLQAELILAYAHTLEPGAQSLKTQNYEGQDLEIPLDPEKTPIENAQRLFDKAKKAKARAEHVHDQRQRLEADRIALLGAVRRAEDSKSLEELEEIEERARERRWLFNQALPAKTTEEKPYEGHRIRERLGPGGIRVLYGENAAANDYLTLRVARPNDIWMHVRGATSAHVVLVTNNKPDRIGPEALRFAAQLAVQNSAAKHSSYVPVDWTLKKHVRKPKGAKAGTATYSHEKTIHVEKGS